MVYIFSQAEVFFYVSVEMVHLCNNISLGIFGIELVGHPMGLTTAAAVQLNASYIYIYMRV